MATSNRFIDLTPNAAAQPDTPPACPKCYSKDTSSAAKRPTAQSYWRCMECGEVWNPSLMVGSTPRWMQR